MREVVSGPDAIEILFGDKPAIAEHQEMMSSRPNIASYRSSDMWRACGPYFTGKGPLGNRTHELEMGETELEGFETLALMLLNLSKA